MSAIPITTRRRRDWFAILRALKAANISYAAVARKCNRDVSTICGWADGGEPKESDARIVLAMFAKHCPQKYVEHQKQFEIRVPVEAQEFPGVSEGGG